MVVENGYFIIQFINSIKYDKQNIINIKKGLLKYLIKGSFYDTMNDVIIKYENYLRRLKEINYKKELFKTYYSHLSESSKNLILLHIQGKDTNFIINKLEVSLRTYFRYMQKIDNTFKFFVKNYTKSKKL